MPMVQSQDAQVAYKIDGSGPGLVLVHGTGGSAEANWSALVPHLSDAYRIVRPDYAGSGDTIDDGRPLTVAILAEQVVAAARAAGAVPFDLVGFSLGAAVAVHIASDYPDCVRSVVLVAGMVSSADPRQRLQFELWRDLIASNRRAMARLLLIAGFSPDFVSAMGEAVIGDVIEQIVTSTNWDGLARQVELDIVLDVTEQAKRIDKPCLIIGCTQDQMVPIGNSRHLAALIDGARLVQINSGHVAPQEKPQELALVIREFLGSATGSA